MQLLDQRLQFSATDLSNFISCHRVTELDVELARGEREKPEYNDPFTAVIQELGLEHEKAYISHLESKGKQVEELRDVDGDSHVERTVNAMKAGAEIIVQAAFDNGRWRGKADILYRVDIPAGDKPSKLGQWYYDIGDTKLAQETKGGTILQLCVYADLISEVQGIPPKKLYVVKPGVGFEEEEYEYANYAAYFRFMRGRFEAAIDSDGDTYPLPVAHCSICKWSRVCETRRRKDDHLSLVAGMQNSHVNELESRGTSTMEAFAIKENAIDGKPARGNIDTYNKLHKQAQIQYKGKIEKRHFTELIPSEQEKFGLKRLPNPSPGDVFFDIESDRFYKDGGLEYLFGIAFRENGERVYKGWWALNRKDEKKAFAELMQFFVQRWESYPDFNIYHFAPYEPAALKRLMLRHSIYAEEMDKLLRAERFIDLRSVTIESVRASVEGYGLKDLEPVIGFNRETPLQHARQALRYVQKALELFGVDAIRDEDKAIVQAYNAEDCYSTEVLRDWLETQRELYCSTIGPIERPALKFGAEEEDDKPKSEYKELFEALTSGLEGIQDDPESFTEEERAKWLLGHLVEYFNREFKNYWWEYYRRRDSDPQDLFDERSAIHGLNYIDTTQPDRKNGNPLVRYSFPFQEVSISKGDTVDYIDRALDPAGARLGAVKEIDLANRIITISQSSSLEEYHPETIQVNSFIGGGSIETALLEYCRRVAKDGIGNTCSDKLLMRKSPLSGEEGVLLADKGEDLLSAAIACADQLDASVLPIQGPPGTGKTYNGARVISHLARTHRVGVTALSHKAIENMLISIRDAQADEKEKARLIHRPGSKSGKTKPDGIEHNKNVEETLDALGDHAVVGATSFFWTSEKARNSLDYLFIDEAGQMSLSYVLALGQAAKNLVMLGDPQQLEQPQQAAHPEGADVSALSHYLGEHQVIPGEKGLFLDTTWRLHPNICDFTSELYYEGKLGWKEGLEGQVLEGTNPISGAGLFYVPVEHEGNRNKSEEEVRVISTLVGQLLSGNSPKWHHLEKGTKPLSKGDIMVIAPYNAQVAALQEALPDMQVGTVDKFQGREAAVVIYSMASSSTEESPRGMAFLFEPNRLNVATSRARCAFVMVASPKLFEAECHSPKQMVWANGMCRYREMSRSVGV